MSDEILLDDLLAHLAAEGLRVDRESALFLSEAHDSGDSAGSPWFIRFFVGLSAWLASLFLLAFVTTITGTLAGPLGIGLLGLLFCGLAVILTRLKRRNDLTMQMALAIGLAGQILVAEEVINQFDLFVGLIVLIFLELILLVLMDSEVQRFLAPLVITASLAVLLYEFELQDGLQLLIALLALAVLLFWQFYERVVLSRAGRMLYPASFGATVALFLLLVLPLFEDLDIGSWWVSTLALSALLLYLAFSIMRELAPARLLPAMLIMTLVLAVLFVPALRAPGILAGLIVYALGYWRNSRAMLGLSGAFLLYYIGSYYYSLTWTLLAKSLALLVAGIVLLTVRFLLEYVEGRHESTMSSGFVQIEPKSE